MALRSVVFRAALWAGVVLAPRAVAAQPKAGDGFMFGAPHGSFTLRAGLSQPTEGSDLFSFVRHELTLSRGDFAGGSVAGDFAFFLRPRVALQLGGAYASRTRPSTYRAFIDNNDREIEQSSAFRRMALSAGLRYYLMPTGRALGDLAWVPARVTAYVGAGVGITWYQFRQAGDFVDYQTMDVFNSTMESSAAAPTAYGAAGVEYALSARLGLTGEARHDMASARMSSDFSGFDRIDVSGTAFTLGLTLRF